MISAPVVISKQRISAPVRQHGFMGLFQKAITPSKAADAIHAIADQYTGKIKQRLLEAFSNLQSQVKVTQLAALIERGASDSEIFTALGMDAADAHFGSSIDAINSAAREAGVLTVTQVAEGLTGLPKIQVFFDQNSPGMIDYLRSRSSDLITTISDDVRANIRNVLANTTESGNGTPMDAARQLRDSIGLTNRQQTAVDNYRYYLENGDARAYARNIGGNAERIIGAAFRDQTMTPTKIDNLVQNYTQRSLQSRAQIIADTESFRAANAGAHDSWKQIGDNMDVPDGSLRRFWVATSDSHTRDAHRNLPLENADGVGLDEPFDSDLGPIMYPGDPLADAANTINCRCRVVVRYTGTPQGFLPPMIAGRSILPAV